MPIDALNIVLEPFLGLCQAWAPISRILRREMKLEELFGLCFGIIDVTLEPPVAD